jgi:hypothetical protein
MNISILNSNPLDSKKMTGCYWKNTIFFTKVNENGTALIRSKTAKHNNLVNKNVLLRNNRPKEENMLRKNNPKKQKKINQVADRAIEKIEACAKMFTKNP